MDAPDRSRPIVEIHRRTFEPMQTMLLQPELPF